MASDTPTTADLKSRIASLSPAQRAALAERLSATRAETVAPPKIKPREAEAAGSTFPASSGQRRLWFLDQLGSERAAYNLPTLWKLSGSMDVDALRQSLTWLSGRHESLRTRLIRDQSLPMPRQVIDPPGEISLPLIDLRTVGITERHSNALALAQADADTPFDLERGPVLRAQLFRMADDEHWLLLNLHHICTDGWSERVICAELTAAYNAFASGQVPQAPALPIQYADYSRWQVEWEESDACRRQLDYWRNALANAVPLVLPGDRHNVGSGSLRGSSVMVDLSPALSQAIWGLSRRLSTTLFGTMVTALFVLLHRHSGQDDIAIGTLAAARTSRELEGVVGLFSNTVVLRADLSGAPTFGALAARVRECVLGAYSHQDIPFERLIEELAPVRNAGRNPWFDVVVNQSPRAHRSLGFNHITAEVLTLESSTSKVALGFNISARAQDVCIEATYQAEKFSAARVGSLLDQYIHLLEQAVADPNQQIGEYTLATPVARKVLPDPTTPMPVRSQPLVAAQIAARSVQAPGRIAISWGETNWTYEELTTRATAIARSLGSLGLERGAVVAVVAPRGFGIIAAMLGVLKSGGAFLTIDPTLPAERQRVMLRESRAKVVLRTDSTLTSIEGLPEPSAEPWTPPEVLPTDPAYVFFTSGSTGVPKAILGSHQGLSHFVKWQGQTFDIGERDRVSQLVDVTFDPFLRDVFLPLTSGATVCVPTDEDLLNPIEWIVRAGVTVIHTGPTLMRSWLHEVDEPVPAEALRWVFVAGEPLDNKLIDQWRRAVPGPGQLVNFYGPTETTMARCYHRIGDDVAPGVQPVGVPIPDSQALIMNAAGELCGMGETGEVVVRTPYRSLGYLNLPEENERRFRRNPFRTDETDVVYYTGDLGRYREDGLIDIVGRIDDQVAVRGLRVEPGEVSATLTRHPQVRHAEVIARRNDDGQYQLIAFVVLKPGAEPNAQALRLFVRERLPLAFVPQTVVFLDELPALASGKVDRKALAACEVHAVTPSKLDEPAAPGDLLEVRLAHIWRRVLEVGVVGTDDNFFELGGHSFLAMRLFAEIEESLGVRLPLATLFEAPTVRALAAALRSKGWTPPWQSLIAIRAHGTRTPLFVIHGVGGNVVGFHHLGAHLDPTQPVFGLQSRGLDGNSPIAVTVEDMARHYIQEMLALQPKGPFHLCGLSFGGRVALELAQQLTRSGHEVGVLALLDAGPGGAAYLLPFTDRAMEKAGQLKRRIEGHLHELRHETDWTAYARRKLKTTRRRLRSRAWQLEYRKHASTGGPLPEELANVKEANFLAARSYVPKPYSGKITLFIAAERLPAEAQALRDAWTKMALGGLDVHVVPGTHVTIIEPPNVSVLAAELQTCLNAYGGQA